jgi:hypothetical protein
VTLSFVWFPDRCYAGPKERLGKPWSEFECFACQSVGKTVKVRERDNFTRKLLEVTQHKRPTECSLCSVSDGIHAMHPLYDTHGLKGRQIYLPQGEGKERRLAWVHTLCGLLAGKHIGVYGCADDGFYSSEDQTCSILPDYEPDNEDLMVQGQPTGLHHFAHWGWLHMVRM